MVDFGVGINLFQSCFGELLILLFYFIDIMQVYKGLSIATAKATSDERSQAPHHMLDIVTPHDEPFTVTHFRDKALPIVSVIPALLPMTLMS